MNSPPLITIAVPSYNQGRFLDEALRSIFEQDLPVEVFLMDGGSVDETSTVIKRWQHRLAGWRSAPDGGQGPAINEGIGHGRAPFVCWLNSDDWLLPGGLRRLIGELEQDPSAAMAYGRTWNCRDATQRMRRAMVIPFSEWVMARVCIISQPGTLIRRSAWEELGGVDPTLHMAMDYDLWWRMFKRFGPPRFVDHFVAVNREHRRTKTNSHRRRHYREAMSVVRQHYGHVPLKWWFAQPYAVWFRSLFRR